MCTRVCVWAEEGGMTVGLSQCSRGSDSPPTSSPPLLWPRTLALIPGCFLPLPYAWGIACVHVQVPYLSMHVTTVLSDLSGSRPWPPAWSTRASSECHMSVTAGAHVLARMPAVAPGSGGSGRSSLPIAIIGSFSRHHRGRPGSSPPATGRPSCRPRGHGGGSELAVAERGSYPPDRGACPRRGSHP